MSGTQLAGSPDMPAPPFDDSNFEFSSAELQQGLVDMAITSELDQVVLMALLAKAMICLSLAATLPEDTSFDSAADRVMTSVATLFDGEDGTAVADAFGAMVEGAAAQIAAELDGCPEFASFMSRSVALQARWSPRVH